MTRDNLTKIRDIAKDVDRGNRNMKALVFCILALTDEIEELKKNAKKNENLEPSHTNGGV